MDPTTCPACGAEIVVGFRRCGSCGAPAPGAHATDEIQRFATVVTSDLKGSTALGERLDPETLREVLTLYFDEMQAVFRSNGGTIEKIIGDAIVAVFGLPVRHEDDALRAVEAAAETQRVLASLNDRLDEKWGVRLVVRTGVATGSVVVGEASLGQHVLTGDTMQLATTMEQNAPPLEVLIAESTYELVRDSVVVEAIEPVTPKGASAAVPAYRLVSVAARAEAGQAAADTVSAGRVRCPVCGQENPDSFQLCGMCGSTLAAAAIFRESRKTVTIVFADPKPTTLSGERPGPEALRDVMSRYFEVMKAALEQHGGTVEKFIGDAVMAVFGLPVRHEDDALRAVRGAAAMQASLPALNDAFRSEWGLELRNHIGVNSGEVIAGDASLGQRLVTGDAVNTAARLEQAAGPQEVILGDLTYRLARDQIDVEAIPPLVLKGKTEPVPAYRLLRVSQRPSERSDPTTPFVGRELEMARLADLLEDVEATRTCRLVTVVGDAGVGKSRLIREFAGRASAHGRAQVLRGRCLPYGDGVTFWPIYEIVRAVAGIDDEDPREVALTKLAAITKDATSRGEDAVAIIDRVAAAIGMSEAQFAGAELFWGIRKLLEEIAGQRPLVAIVDDIHVAAPTFLELIDHLLDAVQGAPILLLTTARPELAESRAEWTERHEPERVVLGPLAADESEAIVAKLLAGLDPAVVRRITDAAEGNPLYVEQIMAMLLETGEIRQDGDGWVAASSSGEIQIPPTVQALVAARLDALNDEERQVIDPASVIGLGFAVDAVSHLVPFESSPEVPARLQALTAKQFVRPTVAESDFYRFGHAVIKDAAYRSLLKRTRAELHERFVGWAEPVNRERGREIEFEEVLGYHLEQAYRYRGELGPLDGIGREVGQRAATKLASAGRRAFGRGDAPAASNLLRRATSVLTTEDPERIELLPDLAEALIEQGSFDGATAVLDEAELLSRSIGDSRLGARGELVRYHLLLNSTGSFGDATVAVERCERTIPVFEAANDLTGLARAWWVIGTIRGTSGGYDETTEAMQRVIDLATTVGDGRLAARGAILYGYATLHGSTPVADAIVRCDEYLTVVRNDRSAEAILLGVLAELHAMRGDFTDARSLLQRSRELIADVGSSVTAASTSLEASRVEMLAGEPSAAEHALRRDYEALTSLGETYFRSTVAGLLGAALWALGRSDEAATYAGVAREIAGDDDVLSQVLWRTVSAKHLAVNGSADAAVALATVAVELAAETVDIELHADALTELAEVLQLTGRGHEQGPRLREALGLYERKGDVVMAGVVRSRLARSDTP